MKKLVLSLIAVSALAFTTKAQTQQGNFVLGGNVQFESSKDRGADKSDNSFSILPSVGYFVADDLAIGTGIGFQTAKSYYPAATNEVGYSYKTSAFVISPFARYYKGLNESFKFFGQLSVPMAFGNDKIGDVNGDNMTKVGKDNSVGVALSPGFAFFPSKRFGIEFSVKGISYNDYSVKDADGNKYDGNKNFNIGANFFAPNIGVQFYL